MHQGDEQVISEEIGEKFKKGNQVSRIPSTAGAAPQSERVDRLVLPEEERSQMPFTKDLYLVRENPHLVAWEREVRKFLRRLSPMHEHRISAVMIYEWATGRNVAQLVADGGNINSDARLINKILRFYFGKAYKTWIMGRQVPNAYRVKHGYHIRRHRPLTVTLLAEYYEGTLNP